MGNTIDSSLFLETNKQGVRNTPSNTLGKDDFLKILMVQLQNQDPLNPMDDKEFIAQMAQFSTLEQITNMSNNFAKFIDFQKTNILASYVGWIGREVDWEIIIRNFDKDGNEIDPTIETGTGTISAVQIGDNGIVELKLDDGRIVYQDEIKSVQGNAKNDYETQLSLASQMVGMNVSWINDEGEKIDRATVTSVHMKNGKIYYELQDGTMIRGQQIVKISKSGQNNDYTIESMDVDED
ncbi:flagellar hook assembly protein FlgD [Calidifontibacillus erzurumensis]|uniref:Basal-body rod modification protein FlgD n=1 Tax=Calidifontibacillus erzurumensis TaxID=2741433 RepID=A0A8J8GC22_9BACI|nr:flagellar hook assembly protein FlgD [Calidifontibacillus erzurumensis]NSL51180.1 flagellar hook assembly protein FlgD [Calidifontibacillus erzurumensis]